MPAIRASRIAMCQRTVTIMTQISMVGHTMKGYKDAGEVYVFGFFFLVCLFLLVLICFVLRTVLLGSSKN